MEYVQGKHWSPEYLKVVRERAELINMQIRIMVMASRPNLMPPPKDCAACRSLSALPARS
ncbi:hypothetical protein DYQ86_16175 [Acidobacteria bacterium AB60]|nr:hypothetical protein DYQ86_16175 [Acidobacteria bacterium AB60]